MNRNFPVVRAPAFYNDGTNWVLRNDQALVPGTTDGASLGTSTVNWSDLFLDSGGVINFDGGDVTLTHSSNTLTLAGGVLDLGSNALNNVGAAGNDLGTNSWDLVNSNAGSANVIRVSNSDNSNAASHARLLLDTGGTSSGDPHVDVQIGGSSARFQYGMNAATETGVISRGAAIGTNDIMRFSDASPSVVTMDTTQGSDFDYVCEVCGESRGTPFVCHGIAAEWHDDVLALAPLFDAVGERAGWLTGKEPGVQHLAKLGVLEISQNNDGTPWIGMNTVNAQWYTWAGMWQNRERMNGMYADASMKIAELQMEVSRLRELVEA